MELTTRFATSDDKVTIDNMLTKLETEIFAERGGPLFLKDLHIKIDKTLSSCVSEFSNTVPTAFPSPLTVILGCVDTTCVGTVILEVDNKIQTENISIHPIANILLLYVDASSRELLVGEKLLNEAKRIAKEMLHCKYITGKTLPGDRTSKSLYENTGFKAQVITMGCSLENS